MTSRTIYNTHHAVLLPPSGTKPFEQEVNILHLLDPVAPDGYASNIEAFCGSTSKFQISPSGIGMETRYESWTGYAICADCLLSPGYGMYLLGGLDD